MNLKNRIRQLEKGSGQGCIFIRFIDDHVSISGQGREWTEEEFEKELAAMKARGDEVVVINFYEPTRSKPE